MAAYALAPLQYASVLGCSNCTVVIGAVGQMLRIEGCTKVTLIAASVRVCISSCHECTFYLGVNRPPLLIGLNRFVQVCCMSCISVLLDQYETTCSLTACGARAQRMDGSGTCTCCRPTVLQSTLNSCELQALEPPWASSSICTPFFGYVTTSPAHSPLPSPPPTLKPCGALLTAASALQHGLRALRRPHGECRSCSHPQSVGHPSHTSTAAWASNSRLS